VLASACFGQPLTPILLDQNIELPKVKGSIESFSKSIDIKMEIIMIKITCPELIKTTITL